MASHSLWIFLPLRFVHAEFISPDEQPPEAVERTWWGGDTQARRVTTMSPAWHWEAWPATGWVICSVPFAFPGPISFIK